MPVLLLRSSPLFAPLSIWLHFRFHFLFFSYVLFLLSLRVSLHYRFLTPLSPVLPLSTPLQSSPKPTSLSFLLYLLLYYFFRCRLWFLLLAFFYSSPTCSSLCISSSLLSSSNFTFVSTLYFILMFHPSFFYGCSFNHFLTPFSSVLPLSSSLWSSLHLTWVSFLLHLSLPLFSSFFFLPSMSFPFIAFLLFRSYFPFLLFHLRIFFYFYLHLPFVSIH